MYSKIQYISSGTTEEQQLNNIKSVLQKGIQWVQLRFKTEDHSAVRRVAHATKFLKQEYDFTFIINDLIDIAQEVDADGVHLGLEDQGVAIARHQLGSDKIVGGTANTWSDVQQRILEGCDYIGLGPLRFTTSKAKLSPLLGVEGYRDIFDELKGSPVPPIYAIGGVTLEDIPLLSSIGVYGVAISSYLEREDLKHLTIHHTNLTI
ncbi:thiamine-phosphate pyrophosphorylase [Sphingobacterium nematocida]|uniref:Thiamine-phosphate synthase n=1 Tax=Sphingobacterium nematocida TaxID=1513896 RepID=A0A1T5DYI7_9SPHI|nr:thiamine phosphate synthase [Sphingobacterium nematocida]SKB76787.1 thiamine-phosphate pyrophosphorylase [Sphingobacterium nematocida]